MGALKSPKCSKGHLMKPPNLYMRPDGQRECLMCKQQRGRDARAKVKKEKSDAE